MPISVTLAPETKDKLPAGSRRRFALLAAAAQRAAKRRYAQVGLVFVGQAAMRALNRRYRKHDKVTDVLSFTYRSSPVEGEIIVCLPQAKRQAAVRKHTLKKELDALITHGLLHLAGHDHMRARERTRMRALEQAVLRLAK